MPDENVSVTGATQPQDNAAPVDTPVQPADVQKHELKGLLEEIVRDIHSDKTSEKALKMLILEFTAAKSEILNAFGRIEEEIKKAGGSL